jgi:plasmid stabilization system protein ParE
MSGFVLHPDALKDLTEIWEYIAAENPGAADRVIEQIHEAIRALVPFPQLGHQRSRCFAGPSAFKKYVARRRIATIYARVPETDVAQPHIRIRQDNGRVAPAL